MRIVYAELKVLNDESFVSKWFKVSIPTPGEPDFYRQVTSLSHFRDRELNRAYPFDNVQQTASPAKTKVKFCSFTESGFIDLLCDKSLIDIDPVIECESMWDFYKAIEYDYKRKKYLTGN